MWRQSRMKFLNKKVNDCVQHIILQKFTNFHAIRSLSFQNICNEMGWPRFLCHPVDTVHKVANNPKFAQSRPRNDYKNTLGKSLVSEQSLLIQPNTVL